MVRRERRNNIDNDFTEIQLKDSNQSTTIKVVDIKTDILYVMKILILSISLHFLEK